ncbi:MAG: Rieske 2Fe-2S domain-containing protein [Rhodothermales bacterium]|nr:Rieske 2Fe-2S domain-containing protein [Rhodothermales bacterium]
MCQPLPNRRDALKAALAVTAGSLLAGRIALAEAVVAPAGPQGTYALPLASYPTLRNVNGSVVATIPGATGIQSRLVVTKTGTTTYAAITATCPHEGSTLGTYSAITQRITCPNHGAQFSPTGTWLGGQDTSNATAYTAVLDAAADVVRITLSTITANEDDEAVAALGLTAAPSVVRTSTTVRFRLAAPSPVRLSVYDLLGREVAVLLDTPSASGDVSATWDASTATSGVYMLRLQAGTLRTQTSVRVTR